MNVDDKVELTRIPLYAMKEWHLGFVRLNGIPKGEQRPSVDWSLETPPRSPLRSQRLSRGYGCGCKTLAVVIEVEDPRTFLRSFV